MPRIVIELLITAPSSRCFDLARSIDLHQLSTQQTRERAIDGVTTGLIGLNQYVTWRARHFGIFQNLTSVITEFDPPHFFVDEMKKGAFRRFRHEHHFVTEGNRTKMTDIFDFQSPLGPIGRLADILFLERYMKNLLEKRNRMIKKYAETTLWKEVLR